MIIYKNKAPINISCKKLGFFGKIFGLMFRKRNTENLLFLFRSEKIIPIHSFFVFFPFLAVWIDGKGRILESKVVRPFSLEVKPKKPFFALIEIPFNDYNIKLIKKLVGKRKV